MKNILKFVFIASIFLFVSVTQIFAEEAKVSQSGVIITTAIREATIVSQDKGIVNLSFKVSNEEGAQAGIKYGVQLIKETKEGSFVADENINNEVFSIGENTTIPKTFVYTAPSYLNGKYKVFVLLKNENSLVLGVGYAGTRATN